MRLTMQLPDRSCILWTRATCITEFWRLWASAFDDDGKQLSQVASRTTADLKASSYRDVMVGGFRLHQEFDVPVNAVSLRLGVEDELNRRLGTVEISVPVPPLPEEAGQHTKTLPDIEPD